MVSTGPLRRAIALGRVRDERRHVNPGNHPVFFERITTIALRVPGSALGFARSRASSDVEIALGEMGNPTLVEALNAPDLLAERQLARAALVQAF